MDKNNVCVNSHVCEESDENSSIICTPEEISENAKEVTQNLLPNKLKERYDLQYNLFMDWCASKKVKKYSESVILTYLSELSEKYKSSTLWAIYSMLKATLLLKHNVNIKTYVKVSAFLKKQSVGHVAKKSRTFNQQDIDTFLTEAADDIYLMTKVALIIGITGACTSDELTNMTIDNITDKDDILIINIPKTKKYKTRTFSLCTVEKQNNLDIVSICKKYFSLRPKNMNSRRLFIKYDVGKCTAQNVGKHTIGSLPSKIATYLNLPNPTDYTGHCFRRTSATLLADSGANILELKRHGGWRSTSVVEGYIQDSIQNKISSVKKMLSTNATITRTEADLSTSGMENHHSLNETSRKDSPETTIQSATATFSEQFQLSNLSKQGISFSNCTINNPVFNINIPKVIKQDIEELSLHTEFDIPVEEEFSHSSEPKTKCLKEIKQELEEVSLHTEFDIPVEEEFSHSSEPKTKCPKEIKQELEELNLHTELDIPVKEEFDSYSPKSKTNCPKEIKQELEEVSFHTEYDIPVKEEFVSLFDSIYNREVSINLPGESWAMHCVNKKYICISQTVVREECPITLRQILIMEDLTLKFFIREKSISNIGQLIDLTNPITNNNLEEIICQFQNVNVCLGGPAEILYPQSMISTTIASVDRSSNNWRHNKCSLIYVGNKLSCLNCFRLHSIFAKQSNL